MAVSERVSVEFTIKDDYDGKGLRQARRDVDAIGESGKKVQGTFELLRTKMDRIAGAMTPLNQGLELVAKAGRFAKEAFDFVQEGANLNQQAQALRNVGIELDRVAAKAKEASAGLVPDAKIQKIIAQFDAYGLSVERVPEVLQAAVKASRRMSISVDEAVDKLVTGTARIEPLLLDNLGLISKVSDFQQRASENTGKAVESLTALEIRAGALDFALERLAESNEGVSLTSLEAANSVGTLSAALDNLWTWAKQDIAEDVERMTRWGVMLGPDWLQNAVKVQNLLSGIEAQTKGTGEAAVAAGDAYEEMLRLQLNFEGRAAEIQSAYGGNTDARTIVARRSLMQSLNEEMQDARDNAADVAEKYRFSLDTLRDIAREQVFIRSLEESASEHLREQTGGLVTLDGLFADQRRQSDALVKLTAAWAGQVAGVAGKFSGMAGEAAVLRQAQDEVNKALTKQIGLVSVLESRYRSISGGAVRTAERVTSVAGRALRKVGQVIVEGLRDKYRRRGGGSPIDQLTDADRIRTEALQEQNRRLQRMNGLSGLGLTLARQKAQVAQINIGLQAELLEIDEKRATAEKKAEDKRQAELRAANSLLEVSKNITLTEKQIADANRARLLEGIALRIELAKVDAEHAAERFKLARERDQSGPGGGTVLDLGAERAYRRELQHRQEVLIARERELAIAQATAAVGGDTSKPEYAIALKQAEFDAETKLARAEMERRAAGREHFAQAAQEISGYIGVVGEAVSHVGSLIDLMETEFGVITKGSKSAEEAQQRLADHKRTMAVAESLVKHFQYVGEAAAATARYEYAAAASYTLAATMHGIVAGVNAAAIGRPPPGRQTETGNAASRNTDRPTTPATVININAPFFTGGNQELGALFNNLSQMGETSGMQEAV